MADVDCAGAQINEQAKVKHIALTEPSSRETAHAGQ